MFNRIIIFLTVMVLGLTGSSFAAGKASVMKPRAVTSLHAAYIGHWKIQGADKKWVDYYVTETTSKWGLFDGEYTVSSEYLVAKEILIDETLTVAGLQSIINQTSIKFSKDYRSALLTYNPSGIDRNGIYYGPEKHRLKYVGE